MIVDANAKSGPWMNAVAHRAAQAMDGGPLFDGPVEVFMTFAFPRPKSHYRTGKRSGELRPDAPVMHSKKPDCDKLVRAIGDGMTGVVYRDDSQISLLHVDKRYVESGGYVSVSVQMLD
jgi:Holliday junction resolvase RusA-like endonuclease